MHTEQECVGHAHSEEYGNDGIPDSRLSEVLLFIQPDTEHRDQKEDGISNEMMPDLPPQIMATEHFRGVVDLMVIGHDFEEHDAGKHPQIDIDEHPERAIFKYGKKKRI